MARAAKPIFLRGKNVAKTPEHNDTGMAVAEGAATTIWIIVCEASGKYCAKLSRITPN